VYKQLNENLFVTKCTCARE